MLACGDPAKDTEKAEDSEPDTQDSEVETADTGHSDTSPETDSETDETADTAIERTGLAGDLSVDTAADAALLGYESTAYGSTFAVASLGDADGDGKGDLVIGLSSLDGDGCESNGTAFFVAGPVDGRSNLSDLATPVRGRDGGDCSYGGEGAGFAVANVGDVDEDGLGDFLVGAPLYRTEGRAYLVSGAPAEEAYLEDVATAVFYGIEVELTEEWLSNSTGESVAGTGDVDGDGTPDLLIGEPLAGRAYLISGDATGEVDLEASARTIIYGDMQVGSGVVGLGDVDGDGLGDFAISSDDAYEGFHVGVFLEPPTGRVEFAEAHIRFAEDPLYGTFGGPGDLDGDGHADIVVVGFNAPGEYEARAAYVFELGASSGLLVYSDATAVLAGGERTVTDDAFTVAPNPVGDFNADGHPDLLIGIYESASPGPGAAWVALGPFSGTTELDDMGALRLHSEGTTDNLGHSVAGAGDLDDDGFDDVLVTAPGYDGVVEDGGAVYVLGGFSI